VNDGKGRKAGAAETGDAKAGSEPGEPDPRRRTRTYVAVIILEALVIAALWLFSRHFSA